MRARVIPIAASNPNASTGEANSNTFAAGLRVWILPTRTSVEAAASISPSNAAPPSALVLKPGDLQRFRYTPVVSLSLDLPITPNLTFHTTRKIQQRQPHRSAIPDHANTTPGSVARSGHAVNHSGKVTATITDRWSLRYINPLGSMVRTIVPGRW